MFPIKRIISNFRKKNRKLITIPMRKKKKNLKIRGLVRENLFPGQPNSTQIENSKKKIKIKIENPR